MATRRFTFDFMAYRRFAVGFSIALTLASLLSLATQGLELGLDFTGGVLLEVMFAAPPNAAEVRTSLAEDGLVNALIQPLGPGNAVQIRLPSPPPGETVENVTTRVTHRLKRLDDTMSVSRVDYLGPQVGDDLTEQGGLAMLFALIGIFIYVMLRFRWKFAVGAIAATLHDAIATIGIFSLLRWTFDLSVLAAVLAVIGYSVNDTIVIYDRIRENFRVMRRSSTEQIVNASVTQTMSRTINTGTTTLLVLFALLFLGGDALWGFSTALILGIFIGTYSSVYVASAMALALKVRSDDLIPVTPKELDSLP